MLKTCLSAGLSSCDSWVLQRGLLIFVRSLIAFFILRLISVQACFYCAVSVLNLSLLCECISGITSLNSCNSLIVCFLRFNLSLAWLNCWSCMFITVGWLIFLGGSPECVSNVIPLGRISPYSCVICCSTFSCDVLSDFLGLFLLGSRIRRLIGFEKCSSYTSQPLRVTCDSLKLRL